MSTISRLSLALLLMSALAACGGGTSSSRPADPPAPPPAYSYRVPADTGDSWGVAHAGELGIDRERLEEMMNDIAAGLWPGIDSIAVARGGRLVFDETVRTTTDRFDADVGNVDPAMHLQFSNTKSITGIAVGIAIEQGFIEGVDIPYLSLFPYESYENWDPRKDEMTLADVLSMRLGLDWNEFDPPYSSPDNQFIRFYAEETDFSKALLDLPLAAAPGTVFSYNTPASVSLGQAIENAAPITLTDFGFTFLLMPLGITEAEVLTTPTGLPDTGRGFYLLTRDMLKFGQLVLDGGSWSGQPVVGGDWIAEMTTARTEITWAEPAQWDWQVTGYGYQWWLGEFEFEGATIETYAAQGFGGQRVMVLPELDTVIAVNASGYDNTVEQRNAPYALIRRYLLPAIR